MMSALQRVVDWFKVVLTDLGLEAPLQSIGTNVADIAQGIVLFGSGLIVGLVARRYLKVMFFAAAVLIGGVKFLEFKGLLTVDWVSIYSFMGIQGDMAVDSFQALGLAYLDWIKTHLVAAFGLILGLYIGLTN
jgi:uncharacterized membrane protein (Fun14 family)